VKSLAIMGALSLCLLVSPSHAGPGELKDRAELADLLGKKPAVTVIDARGSQERAQKLIPFSLIPGEMALEFKGVGLVVADSDREALEIARALSQGGKREVYAVRGGYDTWDQARSSSKVRSVPDLTASKQFTIPSGTCTLGKPLHVYKQ
jgi:rhodanese-related sulfurtransferase